jgi:hypothetical protein
MMAWAASKFSTVTRGSWARARTRPTLCVVPAEPGLVTAGDVVDVEEDP